MDEEQLWWFHCNGQSPVRNVWSWWPQLSSLSSSFNRKIKALLLFLACQWIASEDGSTAYYGASQGRCCRRHRWGLFNLAERPLSEANLHVMWKCIKLNWINLSWMIDASFYMIWCTQFVPVFVKTRIANGVKPEQTLISCAFSPLLRAKEAYRKWLVLTGFCETTGQRILSPPSDSACLSLAVDVSGTSSVS